MQFLVDCAVSAPSGGNAQPWRFVAHHGRLRAEVDPVRSASRLNIADRASFLALGAALEAALVGATALGFSAHPTVTAGAGWEAWELDLHRTGPPTRSRELDLLLRRCCNRTTTPSAPIPAEDLVALAALTRVRFLSPAFHSELVSEIRWSTAQARATRDGIDLASLDLDAADQAVLEMLRSVPAMAVLRQLGLGRALGAMPSPGGGWRRSPEGSECIPGGTVPASALAGGSQHAGARRPDRDRPLRPALRRRRSAAGRDGATRPAADHQRRNRRPVAAP